MGEHGDEVVLVRHGETEWTLSRRHTSRTDIDLTDGGRREARTAGQRLAGREFALVLTSPLARARETCELAGLAGAAQVREDLREWDYGDYEGATTAAIREQRPGWSLWRDGCPGGEQAGDVAARVDRVIAEARAADGDVALFAHGHVLRVLGARWIGLDAAGGAHLALSTASICVLGHERENAALWSWNDTSHLR